MSQLNELVSFFKKTLPEEFTNARVGFDNWMDDPQLKQAKKALGLEQRRLGVLVYTGVLSWDRFPYKKLDPQVVFALVLVWLETHSREEQFQLEEPGIDLELIDGDTAILSITVGLADDISVKPDKNGLIPIKGGKFAICSPAIWIAEDIAIIPGLEELSP